MNRPEIYPFQRVREKRFRGFREILSFHLPFKFSLLTKRGVPALFAELLTAGWTWTLVVGFLMGRAGIMGEILPFAPAFIAAFARGRSKGTWWIGISAVGGLLGVAKGALLWSNVLAWSLLQALVMSDKVKKRSPWVWLPCLTASVLLSVKTAFLMFSGFTVYREVVVIFEAVISGLLTLVFLVAQDSLKSAKRLSDFGLEEGCALGVLGAGLIIGLNDIFVFDLALSDIACRLGIMMGAMAWGFQGGTVAGVLAGIIPSCAAVSQPRMLAIYLLSGLLAGAFQILGKTGVILGFVLGNMLLSVFMMDSYQAMLCFWETVVAALLFIPLAGLVGEQWEEKKAGVPAGEDAGFKVGQMAAERINDLARVFDEISMTFADADTGMPGDKGTHYAARVFQNIAERFCQKCSIHRTCWEREFYQTYRDLFFVLSRAEEKGELAYEDLPPEFRRRCLRPKELVAALNGILEAARVSEFWEGKIEESKDLLSHQLRGISDLIRQLANEISLKSIVDLDYKQFLVRECQKAGVPIKDITPVINEKGERLIRVVAESCPDRETCDVLLAPSISAVVGTKYEVSQRQCPRAGWGSCEFTLAKAFKYKVVTGVAQLAKAHISGDSFNVATLKDGRELIVLSDGMGIGRQAAQESRATVNLLEELLGSGFSHEVALRTVNSVLLLRNNRESFATVDLALINLYTGEVDFVKVGAGPSFLKRGKRVGKITASTLPLGFFSEVDMQGETRQLLPKDILVMVTDGVFDFGRMSEEREAMLMKFLSQSTEEDPHRLAEAIINKALEWSGGRPRDDMTVLCALIVPA